WRSRRTPPWSTPDASSGRSCRACVRACRADRRSSPACTSCRRGGRSRGACSRRLRVPPSGWMPRRSARGRARRPQPGSGVRARRALVLSAALRRLAAVSAPCWRWGSPAWSRRRGSLLSTLRVSHGLLDRHLDGVPVGAGVGSVGGDAVLYGGGVLRGELPGLDRLPRHTLSSQQVVGEIEGGHCGIL